MMMTMTAAAAAVATAVTMAVTMMVVAAVAEVASVAAWCLPHNHTQTHNNIYGLFHFGIVRPNIY